jgi:TonB-dependent receptor-like protein/carboxypeptidase family protein
MTRAIGFLTALIALVAPAAPAAAQSDAIVQGQVIAAVDRSALPGATVTLQTAAGRLPREATTDINGRFVFAQVPPNAYVVSAGIDGFEPRRFTVAIEPREVRVFVLPLEVARLNVNVRVTADAPSLPATHSPSSTMLTAEAIERRAAFARSSVPDAIVTSAPGMIRGHDDFVHVRGEEIALNPIIDGVAFWENPHAMFSAGVSPDIIDTANVMTGAFPAEYGNRFGGVVDVSTKSGLRMRERGSATFSIGDDGRRHAAADAGGRRGPFGYFLSGAALTSNRFLSAPDGEAIHDAGDAWHAFGRFDWTGARVGAMNLIVMGDKSRAEIPKTPQDAALRPDANADQNARQQTVTFGWTRAWSTSVIDAAAYQRWSRLDLYPAAGPLAAHASLTRDVLTVGAKADVTRISGVHTFKVGLDAVALRPQEELDYDYSGYRDLAHMLDLPHLHVADQRITFDGRGRGGEVSAFGQDDIQLGSRLTGDFGLRLDRHALVVDDTHVSPRVNLAFRAGHGAVIHASYNHFFVPPPIEGVLSSSAGLTTQIEEIGTALPALRPATENQFELGGSISSSLLQLNVTTYYRATDNPVHTTVWPDARIYSYASFDRGQAYGLEAKVDVNAFARLGLSGFVNYALGRVEFKNPVTGGFVTEAEHLADTNWFDAPMDQRHTLTAGANYRERRSGIWTGLSVQYGSGTPVGHGDAHHHDGGDEAVLADPVSEEAAARLPGHVTADATIALDLLHSSARRPRLTVRFDVTNVANSLFVVARDSEFSPGQHSAPRQLSLTAQIRF